MRTNMYDRAALEMSREIERHRAAARKAAADAGTSSFTQAGRWTLLTCPEHMRHGESAERPVALVFDHGEDVAELRLTQAEAYALADAIRRHAEKV